MSTQAHSKPRKLRIIHVGAGASGLMTAYKAERTLQNYELVLYDKNPVIGGTWYENRYPGVVNKMKWPDVPGRHSYNGTIAHSATWDPKITWEGKRVALNGTGSSSVQMLPELARGSKCLHIFARNSVWIVPSLGTDLSKANEDGQNPSEQPSTQIYSEKDKDEFRKHPATHLHADEELKQKLIPLWPPGCRRITPGNDYLESLVQDHVKVIFEGVSKFTPTGLVTSEGKEFDFDLIACATGFGISYTPHFQITGIDGVTMKDEWSDSPNIHLGITGPKFPNYFVINGPTGNWGQGCVLPPHEVQIEYAMQCCVKIQNEGIKAMEVKQLPTTQWNEHLDNWHTKYSVWAGDCRSWYKANRTDGRVYIWPGSMLHLLKTMKTPRFEDFNIAYRSDNMWTFL
ncbi:monooxygenase [Fusarium denticulatum]|uniref:Monooxygenase n=1 Tax=Fusarium denticulatum TaxID=48507 RepID=A0A8H5XEV4_9HYPO|nr:monooxygenase [Fusarium denticulatum]